MDQIAFDYDVTGMYWGNAILRIGDQTAALQVSSADYHPLADPLHGVLEIATGADQAHVTWDEEPAENRWIMTRRGCDVQVEIRWFRELDGPRRPDAWGKIVIAGRCSIHALCAALAHGVRQSAPQHVNDDSEDFPYQELSDLESIIAS